MSWSDTISDDDSLELLEERRKTCKALITLHTSELQKWEGLKAKVETAIQLKALKSQIAKTPQPTVAEADLLEHYKKLVESTGKQAPKPETKTETKAAEPAKPTATTPAAADVKTEPKPAEKPAETKSPASAPASPKPAETKAAEPAKVADTPKPVAAEPAKPAAEPAKPAAEPAKPAAEPAKPAAEPAKPAAEPAKPAAEPAKPAEPAAAAAEPAKSTDTDAKAAETVAKPAGEEGGEQLAIEEPTSLGTLGSKPKMRGSTSRAPPTKKADPLVFAPTVVAPSQTEMEEMEKKRAADEAAKPPDTPAKGKKVQPVGFNPLVGMKQASGPPVKYDKCAECSCDDFSPDTFKKSKCSNCFHVHPVSKDQPQPPPTPTAASPTSTPTTAAPSKEEEEEEQPPPPTTPFPGPLPASPAKTSEKEDSKKGDAQKPPPEPLKTDEALKPPPGVESGGMSPNAKKGMVGAKGFNLGLAPVEASTEPVVKCKECGCEDFAPDSFKKTKCSNCFHVHAGAPPPPAAKAAAKPEESAGESVPKCKDCACTSFKPDAFKKSKCSNCFHNHV